MRALGFAMVLVGALALVVLARLWSRQRVRSDYISRNIAIANLGWIAALIAIGIRLLAG